MKKQTIILRTAGSDAQIPKPRLLDSRGKRNNNNKISIYSHKYTATMTSTHSLPEDPPYPTTPFVKLHSESISTQTMDRNIRPIISHQKALSNFDTSPSRGYDERLFALVREQIHAAKSRYQAKMAEMIQSSARTICQLRQMLMDHQKKIVEKQQIIYKLLLDRQAAYISAKNASGPRISLSTSPSLPKLKQGQFSYINNKIQDLQTKLRVFIEAFDASEKKTSTNITHMEQQLIKYNGARLAHCRYSLAKNIEELNKKLNLVQHSVDRCSPKIDINNINKFIESLKFQISQFSLQIQHFKNKQWSYESVSLVKLQQILQNLNQKIQGCSLRGSRLNNYYFQDQDEFFYPNSDAIYQASDQYQHFQEDSQEQSDKKKQNKHPNYKLNPRKDLPI